MAEANEAKAQVRHASQLADELSLDLIAARAQVTDVSVQINHAIRATQDAIRKILPVVSKSRDARYAADAALVGTHDNNVTLGIQWLNVVEDQQTNDAQRLVAVKEQLEILVKEILNSMQQSNEESQQHARGAASQFRVYANKI